MPKDRTWVLLNDRRLEAFQNGCVEFLDFAFPKCAIDNKIRCPCRDCKCRKFGDRDFVHKHLLWRGWDKFYGNGRWTLHLESEEEYVGGQMNDADVVQIPKVVVVNESDDVSVDVDDNIDALEEHGSTIGEDGTEQPYIDTTTPEQLAISADLERVFEESMFQGNEESTANTLAIEKVLGKRKGLGITSSNSSSRRGGTSRLSSSRQEEMEAEMKLLRKQMQDKDDKMEKLQEQMREQAQSFNALLESLRQQGIQAPPPTTSNNGGM